MYFHLPPSTPPRPPRPPRLPRPPCHSPPPRPPPAHLWNHLAGWLPRNLTK